MDEDELDQGPAGHAGPRAPRRRRRHGVLLARVGALALAASTVAAIALKVSPPA